MTNRSTLRNLLVLLLAVTCTAAFAAQSNTSASPLPNDPAALLALAAKHNGLAGPDLKPWHIKATYQLYDAKGKPTQKGTFEEWWAAPNKYKITFDRPNFHLALYATPDGTYFAPYDKLAAPDLQLQRYLIYPFWRFVESSDAALKLRHESISKIRFDCVKTLPAIRKHPSVRGESTTYCLSAKHPILRLTEDEMGDGILYKTIAQFQDRYLGRDIVIGHNGKPVVSAHIVSGEVITHPDTSIFTLPPGAKRHLHPTVPTAGLMPAFIPPHQTGAEPFNYPRRALDRHIQGTVLMDAVIEADGTMHNLKLIASPSPILSKISMEEVQSWHFVPGKLLGIPVSFEVKIPMVYKISPGDTSQFGGGR